MDVSLKAVELLHICALFMPNVYWCYHLCLGNYSVENNATFTGASKTKQVSLEPFSNEVCFYGAQYSLLC